MAVPKRRVSKSKKNIRLKFWKKKAVKKTALALLRGQFLLKLKTQ